LAKANDNEAKPFLFLSAVALHCRQINVTENADHLKQLI